MSPGYVLQAILRTVLTHLRSLRQNTTCVTISFVAGGGGAITPHISSRPNSQLTSATADSTCRSFQQVRATDILIASGRGIPEGPRLVRIQNVVFCT